MDLLFSKVLCSMPRCRHCLCIVLRYDRVQRRIGEAANLRNPVGSLTVPRLYWAYSKTTRLERPALLYLSVVHATAVSAATNHRYVLIFVRATRYSTRVGLRLFPADALLHLYNDACFAFTESAVVRHALFVVQAEATAWIQDLQVAIFRMSQPLQVNARMVHANGHPGAKVCYHVKCGIVFVHLFNSVSPAYCPPFFLGVEVGGGRVFCNSFV